MVESKIKFEKVMKKPSEIMEIDDAIRHAERIVNECEVASRDMGVPTYRRVMDKKCGDEHRQLANWLKELRELWDRYNELWTAYGDSRMANAILRILLKMHEEDDEPDWIPVEEELPEVYDRYLVCFKQGIGIPCRVDICNYGEDCGTFDEEPHWFLDYEKYVALMDDEVVAWMELPEVCEEDETD